MMFCFFTSEPPISLLLLSILNVWFNCRLFDAFQFSFQFILFFFFFFFFSERLFPHTSQPFQTSEYNRHPPQSPPPPRKKIKRILSFSSSQFSISMLKSNAGQRKKKCNKSYSITGYLGNDEPTTTKHRKRGKRDHPSSDRKKKKKGFFFLSYLIIKKKVKTDCDDDMLTDPNFRSWLYNN